ncbi:hypothetical protein GGI04_001427 [Coemansia thaxteri]|nr:hypothetical protein GGI04_001427 [Coemansia thaxteri]KAJ2472740.1 hypothetical protein GGI02_001372 [Coemansia sp. RSA 2322]
MVVPATRSVDEKDNVSPYEDSARYSQRRADSAAFQIPLEAQCHDASIPGEPPYYATSPSATHWSAADQGVVNLEAEKAVHLLRESVVSLLSSGGSTTSSASSAQPGGSNINSRRRYGSLQHQSMYRGISRSPSRLSKASEPNYPASAARRQLMPDLNHFSDVALTSTATPPRHQSTTSASPGHRLGAPPHFPTLEELKQLQQQPLPLPPQSAPHHSGEPLALGVSAPAHPAARFPGRHPLLGDAHQYISEPITTATSQAAWSPFASIRTVSPVLISESGDGNTLGIVSRAQAEAALEQAILCPLKSFTSSNRYNSSNAEKAKQDAVERNNSSSSASAAQTWAKYTGYAIVGFGVGTLVGMLCFDMAATTAPKATRTIPIAVGF